MNNQAGTVVKEYPYGTIRRFTTSTGYTYEAYVPNNCDENTTLMIYEHGDGDTAYNDNWQSYSARFNTTECNSIIIHGDRNMYHPIYDDAASKLGIDITNGNRGAITVSHSGGTSYALQETATILRNNPNSKPAITAVMDGYIPTDHMISSGVVDEFKKNNTIVLAFAQNNNTNHYKDYYRTFASKTGVNTLILIDNSNYGNSHGGVNDSFASAGVLDYLEGRGNLPNNYTIQRYDANTGQFVEVPYEHIANLQSLYGYFGLSAGVHTLEEVTTDTASNNLGIGKYSYLANLDKVVESCDATLAGYLNDIRGCIKSTSFLQANVDSGFSSTTSVPSSIPGVVSSFIASTGALLESVASMTDQFTKIGDSITGTDKDLSQAAGNVNDSVFNVDGTNLANQNGTTPTGTTPTGTTPTGTTPTGTAPSSGTPSGGTPSGGTPSGGSPSGGSPSGGSPSGGSPSGSTPNKPDVEVPNNNFDMTKDFYDFDSLVTDNSKLVYKVSDGLKIVVHRDGNKVLGMEYYYQYPTSDAATSDIKSLMEKYSVQDSFDKIVQSDRYIKVLFKPSSYNTFTADQMGNALSQYTRL